MRKDVLINNLIVLLKYVCIILTYSIFIIGIVFVQTFFVPKRMLLINAIYILFLFILAGVGFYSGYRSEKLIHCIFTLILALTFCIIYVLSSNSGVSIFYDIGICKNSILFGCCIIIGAIFKFIKDNSKKTNRYIKK